MLSSQAIAHKLFKIQILKTKKFGPLEKSSTSPLKNFFQLRFVNKILALYIDF